MTEKEHPGKQFIDIPGIELSIDEKRLKHNYQKYLNRQKLKSEDIEKYTTYHKNRMVEYRQRKKKEMKDIIDNKNKIKKENKTVQILSDNFDKKMNELTKENKKLKEQNDKPTVVIQLDPNKKKTRENIDTIKQEKRKDIFDKITKIQQNMKQPNIKPDTKHWINLIFNLESKISTTEIKKLSKAIFFLDNKHIDKFLNDLNKITKISKSSVNTYLSQGWQIVLNKMRLFNKNEFEQSYQKMKAFTGNVSIQTTNERSKNILKDEDKDKVFDYNPNETIKKLNQIDNLRDKLIFAIYTQNIAPRRLEVGSLRLTSDPLSKLDEQHLPRADRDNFIQLVNGKPVNFVYNVYKTDKKFKRQPIPIKSVVAKLLMDYIKENNLNTKDRSYIFGIVKGTDTPYKYPHATNNNFGSKLTEIFSKVYNTKNLGVRWIRISAASYYQRVYARKTNKKNFISYVMSHDAGQNALYAKYSDNLDEDEEDDDNSFDLLAQVTSEKE